MVDGQTNIQVGEINREDYKDAISLLTKNYVYQLLITGLAHSDIHPGNFRITPDNSRLAILDRYNLIELDESDKRFVKDLIKSLGRGPNEFRERFVDYLLGLEENQHLAGARQGFLAQIRSRQSEDIEQTIIDSMIMFKQQGVKIPLKMTLIGKNVQVLNRMTRDAGFNSIREAFMRSSNLLEAVRYFA